MSCILFIRRFKVLVFNTDCIVGETALSSIFRIDAFDGAWCTRMSASRVFAACSEPRGEIRYCKPLLTFKQEEQKQCLSVICPFTVFSGHAGLWFTVLVAELS